MSAPLPKVVYLRHGAVLSPDGLYRYSLLRVWNDALPVLVFVMLNPSTADGHFDDPTIRKCVGFARRLGYGGIVVVNLFALRATDPKGLRTALNPIGASNRSFIVEAVMGRTAVAAWGANVRTADWMRTQVMLVTELLQLNAAKVIALKVGEDGTPWHPLMLPYDLVPVQFPPRGAA